MKKSLAIIFCISILSLILCSCGGGGSIPTAAPRTEPPLPGSPLAVIAGSPLSFRVLSVSTTNKSLFHPTETEDGALYVLVYIEATNVSDSVASLNSHNNFAFYVNGEAMKQAFDVGVYLQPDYPSINAGDVKRGEIAYQVPVGTTSGEFVILDDNGAEIGRVTLSF
ncbi:MAG: DUF4352 domain-containing protein [Eubacteriales bacterium]|nr:DUF4352 domain-containing protein [Eubacteriales bacterium]